MNKKNYLICFILLLIGISSFAQSQEVETADDKIDTLYNRTNSLMNEMDIVRRLKWSGYVQAQFQLADTAGAYGNSYAGGGWDANVNNRFTIRRSRIKMSYDNNDEFGNTISQIVMQMDLSAGSSGTSTLLPVIRDFYGKFTDPWTRWFGIKAGAMDRPFSYELTYSSGTRETPERGRMSQILFPGEKDFGAQFVIQPVKQSKYNFFKLETGFYNGTGVLNNDFDKKKDWITRLSLFKSNMNETIKYSGGVSYFDGGHKYGTINKYEFGSLNDSTMGWQFIDSTATNINKIGKSRFYGIDGQVSIDWIGGLTTLRAEYVGGKNGGTPTTNNMPRTDSKEDFYQRNFNGAYFYLIHNIMHSKHNILVKYDWYDPNTKVKGNEISSYSSATKNKSLTASDIKYSTLGLGYMLNFDQNWKFLAYADLVKNEITKLSGYKKDRKDNVYTFRIQYTFNKYQ
jgi:hypothetical protein